MGEVGGEASDRKAPAKVTKEYHKGVPRYQEGGRRPSPEKKEVLSSLREVTPRGEPSLSHATR